MSPSILLLQRRDLVKHVALEDCRVVPGGIGEGRGHDVLGQDVQPVRQLTAAIWPPRGEPLVASPALKPSSPAGSWMTPSSETFSLTMIFPIRNSLLMVLPATTAVGGEARLPAGQEIRVLRLISHLF